MSQTINPLKPTTTSTTSTTSTTTPSTIPTLPTPTLSTLPQEIHYKIFHRLTRPSKLVLGLTGPLFLTKLSQYYILERYRHQLRLPSHISFEDPAAQGAIIRFLCASGGDEIDDGCSSIDDNNDGGGGGEEIQATQNQNQNQNENQNRDSESRENEGTEIIEEEEERYGPAALDQPLYEETEEAKEDQAVNGIMNNWTAKKFGDRFKGGVIMCADCSKFVALFGEDGRVVDWANDMLGRQRWFRHCGPCEEKYGITRGSVLTGVQPRFPVPQFLETF